MVARAAHDRTMDGSIPVEVEADAQANELELEEHEEAVLKPRDAVGVRHRIHLPPLVHGHHRGCVWRASRGGYGWGGHWLGAGITAEEGGRRWHGSACGLEECG
jgi:hypothetical protein